MSSEDNIEFLYRKHIEELIRTTSVSSENVFAYIDGSPLEIVLKRAFQFYYEELKNNIGHDLEPSFVFFHSDNSINAFAKREGKANIIGINIGTIGHLHQIFELNENLQLVLENRFTKFPASKMMFETAMHFTFYHELGHLIQRSTFLKKELTEDTRDNFSLKRHILEIDADEFSAILIASHIAQFSTENLGGKLNQNDLEDLLTITSTSILFYLLSFSSSKHEIYYKEYSHPHPTIRIINIMFVMISHFLSTRLDYGVKSDINPNKIVVETIVLAERINDNYFDKVRLSKMRNMVKDNMNNIDDYMKFLKAQKADDVSMATYKWNIYAKSVVDSKNLHKRY